MYNDTLIIGISFLAVLSVLSLGLLFTCRKKLAFYKQQNKRLLKEIEQYRQNNTDLFILKEISAYIGSELEKDSLLHLVCDMLMGLMGLSACSIVLHDSADQALEIYAKSIGLENITSQLRENFKGSVLEQWIKQKRSFSDNKVFLPEYPFFGGRYVGSFAAVPLVKNSFCYGLVLVEHSSQEYFLPKNLDLLKMICTQITIALENAKLYEQMERTAATDGLTPIYNRMYFQKIYPRMVSDSIQSNSSLAVCIFDVDYFKAFNDTYGHISGDRVLETIAALGKITAHEHDGLIARYGGEEFVLLLPGKTLREAEEIVDHLRRKIENQDIIDERMHTRVTASFGISICPDTATDPEILLQAADDAMYAAKEAGRNRVCVAQ